MSSQIIGRTLHTPVALYRGGTSKALLVRADDLPSLDRAVLSTWVSAVYGSPDVRQIDGIGGADPLTSKFAFVGPTSRADADVEYTFAQVSIDQSWVDWSILCGNISSAVGPFAVQEGLVEAVEPVTTVRIYNTNTDTVILARVPVQNGEVVVEGEAVIDGVPFPGAPILLDFAASGGTRKAGVLPTGNVRDVLDVPEIGRVTFSVVDASVPLMFLRPGDLGLRGDETYAELLADKAALARVAEVRRWVAAHLGWATSPETADTESRSAPGPVVVSPPRPWATLAGQQLPAEAADFQARVVGLGVHKAFMVTGAIATGVAASIEGTVVHEAMSVGHQGSLYRIGHPSGVIEAQIETTGTGHDVELQVAGVIRTARRILRGTIEIPLSRVPALVAETSVPA